MATFLELLGDDADADPAPMRESPGQTLQGLRSGISGAGSQLADFAAGGADALGFENAAEGARGVADRMQADAQENAPRINSFRDVTNLRDAWDYSTGMIGQSLPQMAAQVGGALAAKTPVGRLAAAGAAGVPFEAGDVLQRQRNDPVSLRESADDRFVTALGAGGAAAGVNAIVPGAVAGKLAGGAGRVSLREAGQDFGRNVLTEAGAEAGGEVIKQVGGQMGDQPIDIDQGQVAEAFVGGAAAGVPLAGAGAVADAARAPGNALGDAVAGAKDLAGRAVAGARDKLATGREAAATGPGATAQDEQPTSFALDGSDPVETLKGLYDDGAAKARDTWDRIANQEDIADLGRVAGASVEKVRAMLPQLDAERVQQVTQAAQDLMARGGLDQARLAQLQTAMGDLSDRGNQAVVAGLKRGQEATQAFAGRAKSLFDEFAPKVKAAVDGARGVKKSEDFSGIRQAIAQELVPVLQRTNPDIFDDPAALSTAADGLRMAVDSFSKGGKESLTSTQAARLIDVFGDETVNVLDTVYQAMGRTDPAERERFYGALNELQARKKDEDKTLGLMMRSLLPELQETVKTGDLRQELQALRTWAGRTDPGGETSRFKTEQLRFTLESRYGKNADKILEAVEKETRSKDSALMDEQDLLQQQGMSETEAAALQGKAIAYGRGPKSDELALDPDLDPAGDKGQARQALARATKENPDKTVSFVKAEELGENHPAVNAKLKQLLNDFVTAGKEPDEASRMARESIKQYGIVLAEGSRDEPGRVDRTNIREVMVKADEGEKAKTSHYKNKAVFKANGVNYDAIALTKLIEKQFKDEFTEVDNKSALHRKGRMFMTGLAALQDHTGSKPELPDTLVIDQAGTTYGDIKGLDYSPPNKMGEALEKRLEQLRRAYKNAETPEARTEIREEAQNLIDQAKITDPADLERAEAGFDPDPRGNIHELERRGKVEPLNTGLDGASTAKTGAPDAARLKPAEITALKEKFKALGEKAPSAAAKTVAERGLRLLENPTLLNKSAHRTLYAMLTKGKTVSDVGSQVNALFKKYESQLTQSKATKTEPLNVVIHRRERLPGEQAEPVKKMTTSQEHLQELLEKNNRYDADFTSEAFPELASKAEADAYLIGAAKRWIELENKQSDLEKGDDFDAADKHWNENREAIGALGSMFASGSTADLASFYPGFGDGATPSDKTIRAMIDKAVPEVAARRRPKASEVRAAGPAVSDKARAQIRKYIDDVLGPQVRTHLAKIDHAGDFRRTNVADVIRISVHALNPMSVAYHESLHAFFAKLADQGNNAVSDALSKAAMAAPVQSQLRRLLRGEDAALAQLRDPEEAAAYMYQFWSSGQLQLGGKTEGIFTRIANMIRAVFGVWSANRRAEAIMEYFSSGEFKANMGNPSAVAAALVDAGRNQALERVAAFTQPLKDLADALAVAGHQRLRDTGIPALRELADNMKAMSTDEAGDPGFLPSARAERTRVLNALADKLRGIGRVHLQEALHAMQAGTQATTPEAQRVQAVVQGEGGLLPSMLQYMKEAGVDVARVAPRPDYFPRVYDAAYISRHQAAFRQVLENNGVDSSTAEQIMLSIVNSEGSEFTIEVDKPGMQMLKERRLRDVPDAELAPFMQKDLYEILGSYVTQATRRGEWARRFGDDGLGVARLLKQAKEQGATHEQLATARKYVRAIDGTLGDTLNPQARLVMGNLVVYQNIRLLPLAIFSSVVDPMGIMVRGGTVSDAWSTFRRGLREMRNVFKDEFGTDADTQLAEMVGTIDDAMLTHTTSSLYTQGMVGDGTRKINDLFFRYNLMEGFNRSMRVGATRAAVRFLERHADGKASEHSVRWLAELGLKPGEFTGDLNDPKVRAAINRWVDGAVLRPDAADKPIWMNDPHFVLLSHLKQFIYSFHETIIKRVLHEYRNGNYKPAMALSSYVPMMIVADTVKGLLQGGGELPEWKKEWGPAEYLGSGIERAGLLGVGQFAVDAATGDVGALAGPMLDQMLDAAEVAGGKADGGRWLLKALPANALYREVALRE